MSMQAIRDYYHVPAKRGMSIVFDDTPAVIIGSSQSNMHLLIRRDGDKHPVPIHPTWHVKYPATPVAAAQG